MASADVGDNVSSKLFFCHVCSQEVGATEDLTCAICSSGAIEELETINTSQEPNQNQEHDEQDDFVSFWDNMSRGRRRRAHSYGLRQSTNQIPRRRPQVMVHIGSPNNSFQMHSTNSGGPDLDMFVQQLFGNLGVQFSRNGFSAMPMGGNGMGFAGNLGDYAWGPSGLDNIITQLLNQLDNSGPPPAERTKIDSLPIYEITQKDLDEKSECAVCQDQFQLSEKVKQLPCKHNFHTPCIEPWLEMHDSCPICRMNLNGERSRDDR